MPIDSTHLRLYQSERMTDHDDGGGMITGVEIVDGASNGIFPDVASLDRVQGSLQLRKVFAHVRSALSDTLMGSHIIIDQSPTDPNVNVVMWAGDANDLRTDAVGTLLTKGPGAKSAFYLDTVHYVGQSTLSIRSWMDGVAPRPGDAMYVSSGGVDFYFSVVQVVQTQTLLQSSTLRPAVWACIISDEWPFQAGANYDIYGTDWPVYTSSDAADGSIKFYGASTTTAAIASGANTITVDHATLPIVPRSVVGTPADIALDICQPMYVSAGDDLTDSVASAWLNGTASSSSFSLTLSRPVIMPGSVSLAVKSGATVLWTVTDDGQGGMTGTRVISSAMLTISGTIDYDNGAIALTATHPTGILSASLTIAPTYRRAVKDKSLTLSSSIAITSANRGTYYTFDLAPLPAKRTAKVRYMSGGVLYAISDSGAGAMSGAGGTGVINYVSGHVDLYLSRMPDVGSRLVIGWSNADRYTDRHVSIGTAKISLALANTPITPGSVALAWNDGQARTASDNGSGQITGAVTGTIDYATGIIVLNATSTTASWGVNYTAGIARSELFGYPAIDIDLVPGSAEAPVSGSVVLDTGTLRGVVHDVAGVLYSGSTVVGIVNYTTGIASITSYPAISALSVVGKALLTQSGATGITSMIVYIGNVLHGGITVSARRLSDDALITGTSDNAGVITGAGVSGSYDAVFDLLDIAWTAAVKSETITVNATVVTYGYPNLPGVDVARLPTNGVVPIFRVGDIVVLHHTATTALPNNLTAGQTIALPRDLLTSCVLHDANGVEVPTAMYSVNLDTGVITMSSPLDLTGYTQPLTADHRIEDMLLVQDVQTNGTIRTNAGVTHNYPIGATVSSAMLVGDLQGRVSNLFDQQTWDQVYRDTVHGDVAQATFNSAAYPIAITNEGAITERWALVFTGATAFRVVGEHVGQITIGDTSTTCAPVNPNTGTPYFSINPLAWGSGWSAGNVLRFNTVGAQAPAWLARTITQGVASGNADSLRLQIRGDIDA